MSKKHYFWANLLGWDKEREMISFDSNEFSREQAEAEFEPYKALTQKGYPYTGYEYDGKKYHDFKYVGEFEDGEEPTDEWDIRKEVGNRWVEDNLE